MNRPGTVRSLAAGLLLLLLALAAYWNSLQCPFVFDDNGTIRDNPTIRHLWPLGRVLSPPAGQGLTTSGRPLVNLSLAVNYAISGTAVWSYHLFNLGIHILAGLTLFGLARRTLFATAGARPSRPPWPESEEGPDAAGRAGQTSTLLAFALALIWTLHPLQTEAVTYVVQRAESMMGLFYLLTFYCFVRAVDGEAQGGRRKPIWFALSAAACLLGMACKEVMVSAPLMVFLYDRTFVSGSFRSAWRRHGRFYLLLACTWLLLVSEVAGAGSRGDTAGFGTHLGWCPYASTQLSALVGYLRLCLWPHPLVFDYGVGLTTGIARVAPAALFVGLLLVGTLWALRRRPVLGFLGAWFFLILAPSSSVVPVATQVIAEHRMYLPLAAVAALVVCGGSAVLESTWRGRRGVTAWGYVCFLFGLTGALWVLTVRRNRDYRTPLALWGDTVAKRPANARAQNNLSVALYVEGRIPEAIAHGGEAVRLEPENPEAHSDLGISLNAAGRNQEAIAQFLEALRLQPDFPEAHSGLGNALAAAGRFPEAIGQYQIALRLRPDYAEAHSNLGVALSATGRNGEAIAEFEEALRLRAADPKVLGNLARALAGAGRTREAIARYEEALNCRPDFPEAEDELGVVLATSGRMAEAIPHFEHAVRLKPDVAETERDLGAALEAVGLTDEATVHFDRAKRLEAAMPPVRD